MPRIDALEGGMRGEFYQWQVTDLSVDVGMEGVESYACELA